MQAVSTGRALSLAYYLGVMDASGLPEHHPERGLPKGCPEDVQRVYYAGYRAMREITRGCVSAAYNARAGAMTGVAPEACAGRIYLDLAAEVGMV